MNESKDIPIIAISSAKPEEVEPRVIAAGAVAFFPKPIDKDKLFAKIHKLMAEKKPSAPCPSTLRMAI